MDRRGVELSLNLIILVVIGLIVMVIVIYLVASTTGDARGDISGCVQKGGQCGLTCNSGETASSAFAGGCSPGEYCCIPPGALVRDGDYR